MYILLNGLKIKQIKTLMWTTYNTENRLIC